MVHEDDVLSVVLVGHEDVGVLGVSGVGEDGGTSAVPSVPVGYVDGGASAGPVAMAPVVSVVSAVRNDCVAQGVPAGEMPLLTLVVLWVDEDDGTTGVPSCRVDGGASAVFVAGLGGVVSDVPIGPEDAGMSGVSGVGEDGGVPDVPVCRRDDVVSEVLLERKTGGTSEVSV